MKEIKQIEILFEMNVKHLLKDVNLDKVMRIIRNNHETAFSLRTLTLLFYGEDENLTTKLENEVLDVETQRKVNEIYKILDKLLSRKKPLINKHVFDNGNGEVVLYSYNKNSTQGEAILFNLGKNPDEAMTLEEIYSDFPSVPKPSIRSALNTYCDKGIVIRFDVANYFRG